MRNCRLDHAPSGPLARGLAVDHVDRVGAGLGDQADQRVLPHHRVELAGNGTFERFAVLFVHVQVARRELLALFFRSHHRAARDQQAAGLVAQGERCGLADAQHIGGELEDGHRCEGEWAAGKAGRRRAARGVLCPFYRPLRAGLEPRGNTARDDWQRPYNSCSPKERCDSPDRHPSPAARLGPGRLRQRPPVSTALTRP
jgi:hypothetical protein